MIIDLITKIEKYVGADISFTIWTDRSGNISKGQNPKRIKLISWTTKLDMKTKIDNYLKEHNL